MTSFIRRSDLARDRSEQRPERFAVGEKVDARVTQFDKNSGKIGLSIKALEIAEEKAAVEQYGSSDSGASLGDILGAALNKGFSKNVFVPNPAVNPEPYFPRLDLCNLMSCKMPLGVTVFVCSKPNNDRSAVPIDPLLSSAPYS
jgi:predicted RNA-binding protein (virulence factor B family)